jgi:hypothetical protein
MSAVPKPLESARERLKRADENIQQLNREITDFLAPAPVIVLDADVVARKPIITDRDRKTFEELKEFLNNSSVPPRFSVLAGEIIHHLRSSFDHVAWQLSSTDLQAKSPYQIEFPVSLKEPKPCAIKKDKISRYCRKVEGIARPSALVRIDSLQPYRRPNPSRHPLWLIHDLDRIDKHRELVLAVYIMQLNITANAQIRGFGEQMPWEVKPRNVRLVGPPTVDMQAKMSVQVTLGEFSGRDDQPLIPTLQNFLRFTNDAIESFAGEFA